MNKFFNYVKYILKHKWYVFVECCKLGIIYRGIVHDTSKFSLREFIPYMEHFYGKKKAKGFKHAWQNHVQHNDHHWQYWVALDGLDEKGVPIFTPLEMPLFAVLEMIADWRGMHKTIGIKREPNEWYLKNKHKILLHHETRKLIEQELGV